MPGTYANYDKINTFSGKNNANERTLNTDNIQRQTRIYICFSFVNVNDFAAFAYGQLDNYVYI